MTSFKNFLATFDSDAGKRGKQFERFVKWFLKSDPEWSTQVKKIWLWAEYPDRWGKDCGIDLVFKHTNGETWAVQAKCYAPTSSITKADMDTFLSESSRHGIDKRLLIATTDLLAPNAKKVCEAPQAKPVTRFMLSHFESSAREYPAQLENIGKVKKKDPPKPRTHQIEAIAAVAKQFKTVDRGQLIMACGTGKTYTTLWIKEKLVAQNTLVLLPSLGLLSQTLHEWSTKSIKPFEVLCVCSDQSVGKKEEDESIMSVSDLGFPVTSDVKLIQEFIKGPGLRVIFSTYQSSPLIAEAQKNKKIPAFDLVIADEAHRCAGKVGTDFSTVLDNKLIRADKRLFATATPRVYSAAVKTAAEGRGVEMVGMDDEAIFGKVLYSLPFGKAISKNLLTDYQVIIIGVDNPMIAKWIKDRELLAIDQKNTMDAQTLSSQIGLLKAINNYDLKRVISFHSRVNRAESFVHDIQKVAAWVPKKHRPTGKLITDFVSGTMPTDKRRQKLDRIRNLEKEERGILSNARCLSEGVDVPSLDGVAFIDPRASQVDIIQAVGRAIRLSTNKKIGTIILPVFIEDGANAQASIEASNFKPIWDVLYALKAHDDVLSQELDQARTALGKKTLTKNKPGDFSKIVVDLPASVDASFSDSLKTYLVEHATESWYFWYGLLEEFVKKEGHALVPHSFVTIDSFALGNWIDHQRRIKDKLLLNQKSRLESLNGWSWNPLSDQWEKRINYLEAFFKKKKHTQVPKNFITKDGFNLGNWVKVQRTKKETMGSAHKARLEKFNDWIWAKSAVPWEKSFEYLVEFVKSEKHALVPRNYKTKDGFNLGNWVAYQKIQKDKMPSVRKKQFEMLKGWRWDTTSNQWEEGFNYLKAFYKREKHASVPSQFKTQDGFNLGNWCNTQRSNKIDMPLNRKAQLESLKGWSWNLRTDNWEEYFEYLKGFAKKEKHATVPCNFITKNGFRLGGWVRKQRERKSQMSAYRKEKLESLPGWKWDVRSNLVEENWAFGFDVLKKYCKKYGHAIVPNRFHLEKFNLGKWVQTQRREKAKLDLKKVKLLSDLPKWSWDRVEDWWQKGYSYLKKYIKIFGHANVPSRFKFEKYNLGNWVGFQRRRKKKLDKEKIKLLESLPGWCWVAKG